MANDERVEQVHRRAGSRVRSVRVASALVVAISGEIDTSNAEVFFRAVEQTHTAGVVVVDLTEVTFLGAAGLNALLHLRHALSTELRVVAPNRAARRPIELTGLAGVLALFPSVDAATADA